MGKEWLTDEQRWMILENLYDHQETWRMLAQRLDVPYSSVANFKYVAVHEGWTCRLNITPCQFCGEMLLTKRHYQRTLIHPACIAAVTSRARALQLWSPEDDAFLVANVQQGAPTLAKALQRTYLETLERLRQLQHEGRLGASIFIPPAPRQWPGSWSVTEDLYLIQHAADMDRELAKALGRSRHAVSIRYAKLVADGLIPKGSRRWKSGDPTGRVYHTGPRSSSLPIIEDLRRGVPCDEIAFAHGKRVQSVRALAKKHGITPVEPNTRPKKGPRPDTRAVLEDIKAGLSYEAIARKHGKSPAAISSAAFKYGLAGKQAGRRRKFPRPSPPTRLP